MAGPGLRTRGLPTPKLPFAGSVVPGGAFLGLFGEPYGRGKTSYPGLFCDNPYAQPLRWCFPSPASA